MSTDAGSSAAPDYEVMEAAMSVLARKLRAELTVGLLEDYVAGNRTGRSMLAEFDKAQAPFRDERSFPPLADELAEARSALAEDPASGPGRPQMWAIDSRGQIEVAGTPPEWERLRQQARDRDRPIPLWEIFAGLDKLAERQRTGGLRRDRDVAVVDIENAMELPGGVGAEWSLHREVAQAREKLGVDAVPGDPRTLAAMLLRVDAARSLIKPDGFEIGIRPRGAGPSRGVNESTMQRMEAEVQPETIRQMTAQAAIGLVRTDADPLLQRAVDRAMRAGEAAVLTRRAHSVAQTARARAQELRGQRFGARSSLVWATTTAAGAGITAASVAGQTSLAVQVTIGLGLTTLGAAANLIKDWRPNSQALWAPYRALMAEKAAQLADGHERRVQRELNQSHAPTTWRRAGALFRSAQSTVLSRTVSRLEASGEQTAPVTRTPAPRRPPSPGL